MIIYIYPFHYLLMPSFVQLQTYQFEPVFRFSDVIPRPDRSPDPEVLTPNLINLNTVENIHQWLEHPDHIYIGRESIRHLLDESIWGNPFKIGKGKSRDEVIVLYKNFYPKPR
jgi:hypothetical protein